MTRKLVWCLFFFCLLGCSGCINIQYKTGQPGTEKNTEKEEEQKSETIGKVSEEERIVVLTYGDQMMTGMARTICDSIGAVHYALSGTKAELMKNAVKKGEYILIGTSKDVLELEFTLRNCLEEEELAGKKTAFFLLNQEENVEDFEGKFKEWYPEAELLPTFTMEKEANLQDELGRMNGWLTTIMTYGMLEEQKGLQEK